MCDRVKLMSLLLCYNKSCFFKYREQKNREKRALAKNMPKGIDEGDSDLEPETKKQKIIYGELHII